MQKFQVRRKLRVTAYSWPVLLVLCVVVLWLSRAVWGAYEKYGAASAALAEVAREHDSLLARKQELEEKSAWLESEEGIEAEIREHFQVAKPGEGVIVIVGDFATSTATTTPEKPWWQFW